MNTQFLYLLVGDFFGDKREEKEASISSLGDHTERNSSVSSLRARVKKKRGEREEKPLFGYTCIEI